MQANIHVVVYTAGEHSVQAIGVDDDKVPLCLRYGLSGNGTIFAVAVGIIHCRI